MKSEKKNLGFTLVELIVVIAIIAILAAIAVPRVNSFVNDARIAKRDMEFGTVYRAFVSALAESKAKGFYFENNTTILDTTNVNTEKSLLDENIIKVFPAGHSIVANEAVNIHDTTGVVSKNDSGGDKLEKTWGIKVILNEQGKIEAVYISNGNYYSINANPPRGFDNM